MRFDSTKHHTIINVLRRAQYTYTHTCHDALPFRLCIGCCSLSHCIFVIVDMPASISQNRSTINFSFALLYISLHTEMRLIYIQSALYAKPFEYKMDLIIKLCITRNIHITYKTVMFCNRMSNMLMLMLWTFVN